MFLILREKCSFKKVFISDIFKDLLSCAILRQEGIYRRKKRIMPFDPFTPAMHVVIDEKRSEVYGALGREI